jgi:hypothetical protein
MFNLADHPLLVFAVSFVVLWFWAWVGWSFLRKRRTLDEAVRDEFGVILGASLTLLGLLIGFSFSMATSRYDQRKNLEEEEANAIGTEYLRADLLPATDAAKVRTLLKEYLDQRIQFYVARNDEEAQQVNSSTAQVQAELWSTVPAHAAAAPNAITALFASGMNDVINSEGYTQAAWWNRIPTAAWALMVIIAIGCNLLLGYYSRGVKSARLLAILPLFISIAFMLIADIDTPRHGVIRVIPQNLTRVAQSLGSA